MLCSFQYTSLSSLFKKFFLSIFFSMLLCKELPLNFISELIIDNIQKYKCIPLYQANLLNLLTSSKCICVCICVFLRIFYTHNRIICKKRSFYYFLSNFGACISFSRLIVLARHSRTKLNSIGESKHPCCYRLSVAAAAAKSLHSCPTLCDPIDGSPPGSPVPGILQARTLEWVSISFSNE